MATIKPIETRYKGYRMRSRLEARWALYLDLLGVPYKYEPEGFDIDGTWYLPDFFLPNWGMWLEVKPSADAMKECQALLARFAKELPEGEFVACTVGDPYEAHAFLGFPGQGGDGYNIWSFGAAPGDARVGIVCSTGNEYQTIQLFYTRNEYISVADSRPSDLGRNPPVWGAALRARSARFEHGEAG